MRTGDKVVYIQKNLPDIGLIKGRVYQVYGIAECNCSNSPHLDVGLIMPNDKSMTVCGYCGDILNIDERWFICHEAFRLVEEMTIEEKVEAYSKTLLNK